MVNTDKWGTASLTSGSFGQTFKITPLQLVRAIASVVNGGYLLEPYIVSEVLDPQGNTILKQEPTVVRQTISRETSDTMRELIRKMNHQLCDNPVIEEQMSQLIQELETSEFHKAPENQGSDNFHDVCIEKESFLYRLYGSNAEVNTRHHQGVGTIGSGLKVSALWKNGRMQVVEALEHETLPMIGLQWHPERMYIMSDGKRRRDGEIFLRNWLETVDSRKVKIHSSETPDNTYITYSEEGEKNVHMY